MACFVPNRTCVKDPGQLENSDDAMARVSSVQKLGNLASYFLGDLGLVMHFLY